MDTPRDDLFQSLMTELTKIFPGRGATDSAREARNALLLRYHEAVYNYFALKVPYPPQAASELYSNFAVKLLETDRVLRSYDPARGRFRNYLKTVLHHMIMDYYRGNAPVGREAIIDVPEETGPDSDFDPVWTQTLLNKAWQALEKSDRSENKLYYSVLRYVADHPNERGPEVARQLSQGFGRPISNEAVRTTLSRARKQFAELLLQEVEQSMANPTLDELEEELAQVELLAYCRRALEKRRQAVGQRAR
jgi:RNA polymerase sigma-70 factor (ECF subfamily)